MLPLLLPCLMVSSFQDWVGWEEGLAPSFSWEDFGGVTQLPRAVCVFSRVFGKAGDLHTSSLWALAGPCWLPCLGI